VRDAEQQMVQIGERLLPLGAVGAKTTEPLG
jgi:hypothetical protein